MPPNLASHPHTQLGKLTILDGCMGRADLSSFRQMPAHLSMGVRLRFKGYRDYTVQGLGFRGPGIALLRLHFLTLEGVLDQGLYTQLYRVYETLSGVGTLHLFL